MIWLAVILVLPYSILLFRIYRGSRKIKQFRPADQSRQFISVIIACRNEEDNLPLILSDLASQNYPEDLFEVIVVDDCSSDNTAETALLFKAQVPNLRVIENSGTGKKAAIREGVNAAKGSLILTTDADCRIGPLWLSTISSFSSETGAGLIIGPVKMMSTGSFASDFAMIEFLALQGITKGTAETGDPSMCNGANLAFRKMLYLENEGELHPEIPSGDDIFLLHAAKRRKTSAIRWIESPDAVAETRAPDTLVKVFNQRKRWLSKASIYKDRISIQLGIVTFVTILLQAMLTVSLAFDPVYIYMYLAVLFLKSVPDFLLIYNTAKSYSMRKALRWFIPSQLIYPFYVLIVAAGAFAGSHKKD